MICGRYRAHQDELLSDLRTAHENGQRKRANYLQQRYLGILRRSSGSHAVRFHKMNEGTARLIAATEIAESLNAWRGRTKGSWSIGSKGDQLSLFGLS